MARRVVRPRLQVMFIIKRPNPVDPHGHIYAIGGTQIWSGWKLRWTHEEDYAIEFIEQGLIDYFVKVNHRTVPIEVAIHLGHKYLKTRRDVYLPNNLLALAECPAR